jgi:integrase
VLPEPSGSVVILIVLESMRVGEVLALRWKDILADRVIVDERVYEGVLDEVKADSGSREIPFDRSGLIQAALTGAWQRSRFRNPEDFVLATSTGRTLERRNLLNRHIKPAAARLGLDASLDFRSFRTMHSSLMRRTGARPGIVRDNIAHSDLDITLDVLQELGGRASGCRIRRCGAALVFRPGYRSAKQRVPKQHREPSGVAFHKQSRISIKAPIGSPAPKTVHFKIEIRG